MACRRQKIRFPPARAGAAHAHAPIRRDRRPTNLLACGVFMRCMDIEITIGANRRTKRPMQINAKRRQAIGLSAHGGLAHATRSAKQAATNWAKASARCDMACLASGFISPKVKSPPSGKKSGHSRNRFYRASATPVCPQPCPQNFQHGRQAKPKTRRR